jgi:hypothetical protein
MGHALQRALAVAVVAVTLTACGPFKSKSGDDRQAADKPGAVATKARPTQLFPDNFKAACEGASFSLARPYDKAATGHKAVFFETSADGELADSSQYLPDDWTVLFDANGDAYAAVDLTICAKRTAAKFVKDCDGYKIDDKPDPLVVKMHTATYALSVHESNTGKELATKSVEATDGSCPTYLFRVEKGTTTMDKYAVLTEEQVTAFAKPFVQP